MLIYFAGLLSGITIVGLGLAVEHLSTPPAPPAPREPLRLVRKVPNPNPFDWDRDCA